MITLILDGYNVIGAVPELSRQWDRHPQAAREALMALCRAYRARRKDIEQLYVVFDGQAAHADRLHETRGGVTALFTRGEEADERILTMIREEEGKGRFTVVSGDKDLIHSAHALGARILSVQDFYGTTRPSKAQSPPQASDYKVMPSPRQAQHITEELRRHLEARMTNPAHPPSRSVPGLSTPVR